MLQIVAGSSEYTNDEAGAAWLRRMLDTYPKAIWLNPPSRSNSGPTASRSPSSAKSWKRACTRSLGLERAMRYLSK
jgi:uncharacterized protein with von Willebrand factor type A (vWA) domain